LIVEYISQLNNQQKSNLTNENMKSIEKSHYFLQTARITPMAKPIDRIDANKLNHVNRKTG